MCIIYSGCGVYGRVFFFFKQKTAYEMLRSLVGSEMCIRDRLWLAYLVVGLFPNLMFMAAALFALRWLQTAALCSCFLYAFIVVIDTRGVLMPQFLFAFLEICGLVRLRSLSEPAVSYTHLTLPTKRIV
eukprot:TRINITY_DN26752_c0_g1_i1.p2 TRINITY_DN26752_c0_g1~~TRINITY_DN26752_c0_g1_i1.p2  ORF type:complete len:129 (+),score=25.02 TRINITY_DN26752_c0_g1_i1:25-411(+)